MPSLVPALEIKKECSMETRISPQYWLRGYRSVPLSGWNIIWHIGVIPEILSSMRLVRLSKSVSGCWCACWLKLQLLELESTATPINHGLKHVGTRMYEKFTGNLNWVDKIWIVFTVCKWASLGLNGLMRTELEASWATRMIPMCHAGDLYIAGACLRDPW